MQATTGNFPTYVFASVGNGSLTKVIEELRQDSQIDLIAPVLGRYDLVLRLKETAPESVIQAVEKIRGINGVRTTTTHTAIEGFRPNRGFETESALGISLMNVRRQSIQGTIEQLEALPGMVEAYAVQGGFDIVALWQAKTVDDIMKSSFERFPNINGLFRSETLLARIPFYKA